MRPPAPVTLALAPAAPLVFVSSSITRLVEPETLEASPEQVAAVVTAGASPPHPITDHRVSETHIDISPDVARIMDMGFSSEQARAALAHDSDVQVAIEWLLTS